jgi:hypothetical protein
MYMRHQQLTGDYGRIIQDMYSFSCEGSLGMDLRLILIDIRKKYCSTNNFSNDDDVNIGLHPKPLNEVSAFHATTWSSFSIGVRVDCS